VDASSLSVSIVATGDIALTIRGLPLREAAGPGATFAASAVADDISQYDDLVRFALARPGVSLDISSSGAMLLDAWVGALLIDDVRAVAVERESCFRSFVSSRRGDAHSAHSGPSLKSLHSAQ
jgi:hypothetical protein